MGGESAFEHRIAFDDQMSDAPDLLVLRPSSKFFLSCAVWIGIASGVLCLLPLWLLGWSLWLAAFACAVGCGTVIVGMLRERNRIRSGTLDLVVDVQSRRLDLFDIRQRSRRSVSFDHVVAIIDRHCFNGRYEHLEFACSAETEPAPIQVSSRPSIFDREAWELAGVGNRVAALIGVPIAHDHSHD